MECGCEEEVPEAFDKQPVTLAPWLFLSTLDTAVFSAETLRGCGTSSREQKNLEPIVERRAIMSCAIATLNSGSSIFEVRTRSVRKAFAALRLHQSFRHASPDHIVQIAAAENDLPHNRLEDRSQLIVSILPWIVLTQPRCPSIPGLSIPGLV